MRIALVSTPFVPVPPPAYGGTELVIHHLLRGLREEGAEPILYATGDSRDDCGRPARSRFPRATWPPDPRADGEHAAFATEDARALGCDVVHVNSPSALCAAAAAGLATVCTVHHAADPALSAIYARADAARLVAISERQRALDPALAAARVIPHGLDPEAYPLSRAPGDAVLFLGRLSPAKGPHLAIDAARLAERPIRLAGKVHPEPGAESFFAEELAPRLAGPGVAWIGEVGGRAKLALLGGAAALLAPVRWEEPFGLAVVEAMLCGTPVVAFPRGALPEIVEDGVTGFIVPDDDVDAMARAIGRAARLDRGAVRARAAERFHYRRMARAYLEAYAGGARP